MPRRHGEREDSRAETALFDLESEPDVIIEANNKRTEARDKCVS